MKNLVTFVLLAALVVTPTRSFAFDGSRSGFILNLGLGMGKAKQGVSADAGALGSISADVSNTAKFVDFKIGGGINEQVLVYFIDHGSVFSLDRGVNDTGESRGSTQIYQAFGGVGTTYFLKPEAPSFFIQGGIGVGILGQVSTGVSGPDAGFGFQLGAGFELIPGLSIQADFMHTDIENSVLETGPDGFSFDAWIQNLSFTLNWTFY